MSNLNNHKGFSVIELGVGLLILSIALIPTLSLFPTELKVTNADKARSILLYLAQEKVDETTHTLQGNYQATLTTSGDFSGAGFSQYRYTLSASEVVARLLKSFTVSVWEDTNGNTIQDASETNVSLSTQVANRAL